jgi:hypothetical protein
MKRRVSRVMAFAELQELVDAPNETLGVEYKSGLDLSNQEARADLARHIAAIANHGGGYIVFGFDDLTLQYVASPFAKAIDRDNISSIVKKYLEPTFQCDVVFVRSNAGNEHAIVSVPAHGATPICAKANGPMDGKRVQGIVQGQYYLRKAGPESAPIVTAAEWSQVIRRCAMHDRAAILGALDAALRGGGRQAPTGHETLKKWHEAAHAEFLNEVVNHKGCENFARWNWQLSYSIDRADEQQLSHQNLLTTLREVNSEVRDLVKTGWSMFYVFDVPEISPTWQTDAATGLGENDFLECALLKDTRKDFPLHPDMWRISPLGKATLIRTYWEDDVGWNKQLRSQPGTWLSPNLLTKALAELARHARGMAERFDNPTEVTFRVEWNGLKDRIISDPFARWTNNWISRSDHRLTTGTWPVTKLTNGWPEIAAELAAPLMRLFTTEFVLSPDWIRGKSPTWVRE